MERKWRILEEEIKKTILGLEERLGIKEKIESDLVIDLEDYNKIINHIEKLKNHLYDYYALRLKYDDAWWPIYLRRMYSFPEMPVTVFSRVKVLVEKVNLTENESLDVLTSLLDEQTDFGILHFIPMLGRNDRNLGAGIVVDNHNFGWHYHFCKGGEIDKHIRTTLMFTNHFDTNQKFEGLYCGQHGSNYAQMTADDLNHKTISALIQKNRDLIKKYKPLDWMKKLDKFQIFWKPDS